MGFCACFSLHVLVVDVLCDCFLEEFPRFGSEDFVFAVDDVVDGVFGDSGAGGEATERLVWACDLLE